MHVAVACGGTGGHVVPGLAAARRLRERGHTVTLWLAGRDVERASLADWDGPVVRVRAAGLPARPSPRAVGAAGRLLAAAGVCFRQLGRSRPDVLLAMGSYASFGPVVAARCRGIPVVLHEANAVAGRAVGLLAGLAARVAVAFPLVRGISAQRQVVTGLPLRAGLGDGGPRPPGLASGLFTVLVMGGSLGAGALNAAVPAALRRLHGDGLPLQVLHLAGEDDADAVRRQYAAAAVPHVVHAFYAGMAGAYAAADVAVTRAGASTCMELAACRLPALLVPLPGAPRDHQTANARVFADAGAAVLLPQAELTAGRVAGVLARLHGDPAQRERMRAAAGTLAQPHAAARLADVVEECAPSGGR